MNRTERQEFVQKLRQAAAKREDDDDTLFADIICQAVDDLSEAEMSKLLQVSRPTINRWKHGKTTPHRLMKPVVYERLAKHLQQRAEERA